MSPKVRATIVDRSLLIGQAIACRVAQDRIGRVRTLHAASVDEITSDGQAAKLTEEMIRLANVQEQKLGTRRCDVISSAFAGLEKLLSARVRTAGF